MPTTWTPRATLATSWTPRGAATALWSVDDGYPDEIDGGAAATQLWLGAWDGGGAVAATLDVAVGIGPQRTAWATQAAP